MDKYYSLLRKSINHGCKMFYRIGPWSLTFKVYIDITQNQILPETYMDQSFSFKTLPENKIKMSNSNLTRAFFCFCKWEKVYHTREK